MQGSGSGSGSTGRVLWIIFCCFMAACWFFFTWWTFVIPLVMVPLSLLAILLPVGKGPRGQYQPRPASGFAAPPGWYEVSPGVRQWWDGYQWAPYRTTGPRYSPHNPSWPPPSLPGKTQ